MAMLLRLFLSERRNLMIVQLFGMRGRRPRDRLSARHLRARGRKSEVFDDIIDRETDVAPHRRRRRIGFQVCIFRHCRVRGAAVAARSEIDGRHPDESPAHGEPAQCDGRATAGILRPSRVVGRFDL
jgi:hypothetical protein